MNTASKKIVFVRTESWPYANVKMAKVIQDEFQEYEVVIFEVYDKIKSQPFIVFRNILEVFKVYGWEIFSGKKRFKRCFWRTPYIFHEMRRQIQEFILSGNFLFSFQIQSLFDASVEGLPHFVYTDHTHLANLSYPGFDRTSLYSQNWIDLERSIYLNASLIFVRSSNILESLIKDYQCPPMKVICAYAGSNAVDHDANFEKKEYDKKHILFIGIDWERKGGPDLVAAFELVRRVHPDAILTVLGSSPEINFPNCHVMGRVPVDDVGKYLRDASVFCLPTHLEPFGVALVEAMASKLPIVATNVGAIPDFVHDKSTGFLVSPGDIQGIANSLIALISDPGLCREFGEKGYELARQRYSWSAVGRLMKSYMIKVIS